MSFIIINLVLLSPLLVALVIACGVSVVNAARGSRRSIFALIGFCWLLAGDVLSVVQPLLWDFAVQSDRVPSSWLNIAPPR
jgi:hypothetical protein